MAKCGGGGRHSDGSRYDVLFVAIDVMSKQMKKYVIMIILVVDWLSCISTSEITSGRALEIEPEQFLVLFRPGTTLVRSGLKTFFVLEPEHKHSLCS